MAPEAHQWSLLQKAVDHVEPHQFDEYFALKELLARKTPAKRLEFQRRFASFYRLHIGGLTDEFKKRW